MNKIKSLTLTLTALAGGVFAAGSALAAPPLGTLYPGQEATAIFSMPAVPFYFFIIVNGGNEATGDVGVSYRVPDLGPEIKCALPGAGNPVLLPGTEIDHQMQCRGTSEHTVFPSTVTIKGIRPHSGTTPGPDRFHVALFDEEGVRIGFDYAEYTVP